MVHVMEIQQKFIRVSINIKGGEMMTNTNFGNFVSERIDDFVRQNYKKIKGTMEYEGAKIPLVVESGYDPTEGSLPWYIKADVILPGKPRQVIPNKMCYDSQESFEKELKEYLKEIEIID